MPRHRRHGLAHDGTRWERVFRERTGYIRGIFVACSVRMRHPFSFALAHRRASDVVLRLRLSLVPAAIGMACSSLTVGCSTHVDKTAPLTNDAGMTECRSDSDCAQLANGPWNCAGPNGPYFCGPVVQVGVACTVDSVCGRGSVCRETTMLDGGLGPSGKVCTDAACTDDSQCSAGQVCRKDPNVRIGELDPDGVVCALPCATDRDCAPTDKCESAGHCIARTCADCPSYFSCTSGTCVIPSCSTDPECPGGYCVDGICAGSLGVCRMTCF